MGSESVELALLSARQVLAALTAGDTAAFERLWPGYEAACNALTGPATSTSPSLHLALDELIAVHLHVARAIEEVLGETAERMATLRRGGQTNAAYAASSRFA
ncbi:MAG: hypothetical protein KJ048_11320 [Dehalococcoidia bacterium]|nr:hypothetical protein [Dehalococcoidia bacterium]